MISFMPDPWESGCWTAETIPLPGDVVEAGGGCLARYVALVLEEGQSPRFAEMLALRQFPRIMTDDVALGGMTTISQMHDRNPEETAAICEEAVKRGYRPKPTDVYLPSVAAERGDPAAFINHGQGRGHLKKVLEARGQESHGLVETAGREPSSDPHDDVVHELHPRIVERIRKRRIKDNPDLARGDQAALRADIIATHSSK